ncbi:cytochrome c biogenesis protein CcdA [Actinoplanes sp. NEAU-A12]|uniref:Cytochrome c biogenesis protein CcdA n=1 Tax=Actinoplanes sandaracinus TaxID=3045177 RepID=A0ABT6WUD7_9ACTN|nr:cytochrome c biogenesis protein CcdA [Actinoplanes sandaracinus]MDI6103367.1 cytochrome c biogenesis protein CcdA [Actinoplanes sandaracinus]
MDDLTFALAAGLLAAFNPCGFALLPSFLLLLVSGPGGVLRALRLSAAMTAGFVTVFGVAGVLIGVVTAPIQQHLPWFTVVVGVVLVLLGAWLLSGRELQVPLPRLKAGGPSGSLLGLYGYGASYAVASLSCTIAPFLAVTGLVSGGGDVLAGLAAFLAYGLGMGLVVGLLALLVAFAQDTVVRRTRAVLPFVSRASGALLVLAGLYVAYYGWYELRVNAGGSADDPVVGAVTELPGMISNRLDAIGAGWVAAAFALTAAAALLARARRGRSTGEPLGRAGGEGEPGDRRSSRG